MAEKPVMISDAERKAELLAELALSRAQLTRALHDAGEDLNVAARLKHSIAHRKTAWFTGAAFAGWLLSRLPRRRKAAAPKPPDVSAWVQKTGRTGFWLAALNLLLNLCKPFLTALATRKIGQLSARSDWGGRGNR
ncbi:MAG: hypothetical protein WCH57_10165 [Verrucomicrobiota bacterium]